MINQPCRTKISIYKIFKEVLRMLIKCPECDLQVSDKATFCPHCGYPLQPDIKQRKPRSKNNKRRRLPNGFGQISEIKNRNLRNPFRAMVTVGKTSTGRPICKPLKPESYFPTYNTLSNIIRNDFLFFCCRNPNFTRTIVMSLRNGVLFIL